MKSYKKHKKVVILKKKKLKQNRKIKMLKISRKK